jgi:hypothetical protein
VHPLNAEARVKPPFNKSIEQGKLSPKKQKEREKA